MSLDLSNTVAATAGNVWWWVLGIAAVVGLVWWWSAASSSRHRHTAMGGDGNQPHDGGDGDQSPPPGDGGQG